MTAALDAADFIADLWEDSDARSTNVIGDWVASSYVPPRRKRLMSKRAILKVACLTVIGLPGILSATAGLDLPPGAWAVISVLSLAAGYTLSELDPGWKA